jgi:hypothetical protein
MSDTPRIKETKAHCNVCGGSRTHKVLFSEESSWNDDDNGVCGGDTYDMLKCGGCDSIKLRLKEWCSEDPCNEKGHLIPRISYYPSAVFRPKPRWLVDLMLEVSWDEGNVHELLSEIYVALQNDQRALAAMGIRALLEKIMVEKSGDHGTFAANLKEFENQGYVSRIQRERLETILEAGHAAMHRLYKPSKVDLVTLVDIAESVVESIYIHGAKVEKLKNGIPPRAPKAKR